jgi:thiamine biosynthesis lipoprotein
MKQTANPASTTRSRRGLLRIIIPFLALLCSCDGGEVVERLTVLALDTAVELTVVAPDSPTAQAALEAAAEALRSVEAWASTTDPGSELARLNAAGGSEQLGRPLAECLELALAAAADSNGAFDPTIGPLLEAYGFTGEAWRVPTPQELAAALARVGYEELRFTGGGLELPPGFVLDLGGAAKGYAVDGACAALENAGATAGLVNAGGDIACFGERPGGGPWRVGVQHPRAPSELYAVLELDGGAVATSGDYERCFTVDGVRYHHLLDPRSGRPARELTSVTVTAPSCAAADAYATAAFILGPRDGRALLEEHPELEGLLIGVAPGLEAHETGGFTADYETPGD